MNVIAITVCLTGIAHIYMAADSLQQSAKQLGILIKVETQGVMGIDHYLTEQNVRHAEMVIFVRILRSNKKSYLIT